MPKVSEEVEKALRADPKETKSILRNLAEQFRGLCDITADHEKRLENLEVTVPLALEALKARIASLPEEKQESAWKLFLELSELLGFPEFIRG